MVEVSYVVFGLASPFIAIWLLIHWVGRFNEYLNRNKTLRRMNDFSNIYWDYNHNIWVTKSVAETQQPKVD